MKIRNGFVSNSSSSSFIILGVKYTREELEKKFGGDWNLVQFENCVTYYDCSEEDTHFIGIVLQEEEDEITPNVYSMGFLSETANIVATELNENFEDIKIYSGRRYC